MPTAAEHVAQARRNEGAAAQARDTYPEWAIAALFYAAMHYVEAFFDVQQTARSLPRHYATHEARRRAIRERARRIYDPYEILFNEGWVARYDCRPFSPEDVDALRDGELAAVKAYVVPRLPPDLQLDAGLDPQPGADL